MRWTWLVGWGVLVAASGEARAERWVDATADCLGTTAQWTNDVEVADVDGDGAVDILLANGGDYDSPGTPEVARVWRNTGNWDAAGAHCSEVTADLGFTGLSRVIRAADLDGDGALEILTGGAYQTQLRLFEREGAAWVDASARLPQQPTSIGDVELGDVDGDGDLDLLLAEWGATPPGAANYAGGTTRLYRNDAGTFVDATAAQMPAVLVEWSWDVELADVDGDWDLDALVACKLCTRSRLFRNDGAGTFTDDATAIPAASNNYDFEPMDLDADGDLDLVTVNDGGSLRDRILVNDGSGRFADETAARLPATTADDNAALWLDADSDGDADLLFGTLGTERLYLNDGSGHFTLSPGATPNDTRGTLAIALADLDGDGRLDLVQGQGEAAFADKIQRATDQVAVDTAAPVISGFAVRGGAIVARVHDHLSPIRPHDWQRVWAELDGTEVDLAWVGEYLWRGAITGTPAMVRVCARDRRGNEACSDSPVTGDGAPAGDAGTGSEEPAAGGGCCDAGTRPTGLLLPLALGVLGLVGLSARNRSRSRGCGSGARRRRSRRACRGAAPTA